MTPTEHWTTILLIAVAIAATVPLGCRVLGVTTSTTVPVLAATGALAAISMLIPSGAVAGALATPWLLTAATVTVQRITRCLREARRNGWTPAWTIDAFLEIAAVVWWTNAAMWLVAHRAGIEPLGFTRPIALLTVGHFHHAGFGLTALLVAGHRRLGARTSTRLICVTHQLGMVTVAIGISFSDHLEVAGATVITIALAGWAWMAIGPLRTSAANTLRRQLFTVSAVAWAVPMLLAIGWALGPFLADPVIRTFETMLRFHAAINSIGLVLAGLAALATTTTTTVLPQPARTHLLAHRPRQQRDHNDHVHTTR